MIDMTVSITEQKYQNLILKIDHILGQQYPTIKEVAGTMVSYTLGVKYAPLYYTQLEIEKNSALKSNFGDYGKTMQLSHSAISDLKWWNSSISVNAGKPSYILQTDASMLGLGAVCDKNKCSGRWNVCEKLLHINELELMAIQFGLKSLCSNLKQCHVLIKCDNTTAVAYVQNMGGTRFIACNKVARSIWM